MRYWATASVLLGFMRANAGHTLRDSVLSLLEPILRLVIIGQTDLRDIRLWGSAFLRTRYVQSQHMHASSTDSGEPATELPTTLAAASSSLSQAKRKHAVL